MNQTPCVAETGEGWGKNHFSWLLTFFFKWKKKTQYFQISEIYLFILAVKWGNKTFVLTLHLFPSAFQSWTIWFLSGHMSLVVVCFLSLEKKIYLDFCHLYICILKWPKLSSISLSAKGRLKAGKPLRGRDNSRAFDCTLDLQSLILWFSMCSITWNHFLLAPSPTNSYFA